jgi:hypothetical protein
MKYLSKVCYIIVVFYATNTSAQWSMLHPNKDTLFFKGTYDIELSMTYDSVKSVGNTKVIYLQREFETDSINSYGANYGLINGEHWLGNRIIETPDKISIITHNDTLTLPIKEDTTVSRLNGAKLTVVNLGVHPQLHPNVGYDSIMTFYVTASNNPTELGKCLHNKSIVISKLKGLISFPSCFKTQPTAFNKTKMEHIRIGQVNQSSFKLPSIEQFFNYSPGDELHYSHLWSRSNYHYSYYNSKYTILKKNIGLDSNISYTVYLEHQKKAYGKQTEYSYDTLTWHLSGNIDSLGSSPHIFNTRRLTGSSLVYDFKKSTKGPWHLGVATGYWTDKKLTSYHQDPVLTFTDMRLWVPDLSVERFSLERYGLKWFTYPLYVEGIGYVYSEMIDNGSADGYEKLVYYKINGTTWGNPLNIPPLIIEEPAASDSLNPFVIFPSPATNVLTLKGTLTKSETLNWTIADFSGRAVISGTLHPDQRNIDISKIESGTYLLSIEGQKTKKFSKVDY